MLNTPQRGLRPARTCSRLTAKRHHHPVTPLPRLYISSSLPLQQVSLESLLLPMRNLTSFKNDVEWIYPVSVDERENNKRTSDTAVGGLSLVKDAAAVIIIYNKEKGSLLKSRASISRSRH